MAVKKRAEFGTTRRTSSGKVQARYVDAYGQRHTLGTFASEKAARAALAAVQTDITRGDWTDETKGQGLFSALAEQVLTVQSHAFSESNRHWLLQPEVTRSSEVRASRTAWRIEPRTLPQSLRERSIDGLPQVASSQRHGAGRALGRRSE